MGPAQPGTGANPLYDYSNDLLPAIGPAGSR